MRSTFTPKKDRATDDPSPNAKSSAQGAGKAAGLPPFLNNSTDRQQAHPSTIEPAVESQTVKSIGECTFKLMVGGIVYCFTATGGKPGRYLLEAKSPGKKAVKYEAEIVVEVSKNKRSIKSLKRPAEDTITMHGYKGEKLLPVTIEVDLAAIAIAWDAAAPDLTAVSKETDKPVWDFVVLEVHFTIEKRLPVRRVFWMRSKWETWKADAGGPPIGGGTVATFRLDASQLGELSRLFAPSEGIQNYTNTVQANVWKIIQGRTPEKEETSEKTFNPDTFIGAKLASPSWDIESGSGPGAVSNVPFPEAVGKWRPGKKAFWVESALVPPATIKANFKSNESALPGGLDSSSLATFKDEVRLVLLYLHDTPDVDIAIHAHTDTVGTVEENCTLSQARAESAQKYLTNTTIWTGTTGTPKALAPGRIIMTQGEGQTLAEEDFKKQFPDDWTRLKNNPTEWQKLIGSKSAANADFRLFKIEYIPR